MPPSAALSTLAGIMRWAWATPHRTVADTIVILVAPVDRIGVAAVVQLPPRFSPAKIYAALARRSATGFAQTILFPYRKGFNFTPDASWPLVVGSW